MRESDRQWDAFLSYAHEDRQTVEWLHGLLTRYWVVGRRRRRIFLDRHSLRAGGLSSELRQALHASRYLIVCCSPHTAGSAWVEEEIREFLTTHPPTHVLACTVGAPGEALVRVPTGLAQVETLRAEPLFRPDLRGSVHSRTELRHMRREALSLLASVLELHGKDDIVSRRREVLFAAGLGAVLALLLAGAGFAGWRWWLTTPGGRFHEALQQVVRTSASEQLEDRQVLETARALGVMGQRDALEQVSHFMRDPAHQALARVGGYVSLPQPDCAAAREEATQIDAQTARHWPEPLLWARSRCPDWKDSLQPVVETGDDVLRWGRLYARTGHPQEAKRLLADQRLPRHEALALQVSLAASGAEDFSGTLEDLRAWFDARSGSDVILDLTELLLEVELAGRLGHSSFEPLLDMTEAVAQQMETDAVSWNPAQELAARLAGAGRKEAAEALLARSEPPTGSYRNNPYWASGWVWRGLAQARLGAAEVARRSFDEGLASARALERGSRSYSEWHDIALAHVLAGDWRNAFDAAQEPATERERALLRMKLITWWQARHEAGRFPWE